MTQPKNKKPFIPKDKPKSWVIFTLACLSGLLVAGPILIGGNILKIKAISTIGMALFILCWSVAAIVWVIYITHFLAGHYKQIEERDWKDQIW
jgi:hypothetical protein